MATNPYVVVNVYEGGRGDGAPWEVLMAKVDEVQAQLDDLAGAVRGLLGRIEAPVSELEAQLAQLQADDAVENAKLEAIGQTIAQLRSEVDRAGGTVDDVTASTGDESPPPPADEPVDPTPADGGDADAGSGSATADSPV